MTFSEIDLIIQKLKKQIQKHFISFLKRIIKREEVCDERKTKLLIALTWI